MIRFANNVVTGTAMIPLLTFAILVFYGSAIGKPWAGWVAVAAIAASCVLSSIVLVEWIGMDTAARQAAAALGAGARRMLARRR